MRKKSSNMWIWGKRWILGVPLFPILVVLCEVCTLMLSGPALNWFTAFDLASYQLLKIAWYVAKRKREHKELEEEKKKGLELVIFFYFLNVNHIVSQQKMVKEDPKDLSKRKLQKRIWEDSCNFTPGLLLMTTSKWTAPVSFWVLIS